MGTDYFESIVEQVIASSFGNLMSQERINQIDDIGKCWDFYYGYQEQYIKQYRGESPEDYQDKDKPTFNYTRSIVDEYVEGVFGKPVGIHPEDKKIEEIWNNISQPLSFFNMMPFLGRVQRVAEISNTCVVMIRFDPKTKLVYFEDIRGEYVSYLPDKENPKEKGTLIISYEYDTGDPHPDRRFLRRVEIWDKKEWAVWLYSPSLKDRKKIDSGPNPYGFLPAIAFMPLEDDNTFFGISNINDIVIVNEIYNNLWVALLRISVFQSFSILMIKTDDDINLEVAPTRFLKLKDTGTGVSDAKYITPSPQLDQVRKTMIELKKELQNLSKTPAEVTQSADIASVPASGYSLRIKRIPIDQLWKSRKLNYGPSLRDMVRKAVVIQDINEGGTTFNKNDSGKDIAVDIRFTDTTAPLSPQEQLMEDQFMLAQSLITPIDILMRENPEMTRDEAKLKILNNKKEMLELNMSDFEEGETFDNYEGEFGE